MLQTLAFSITLGTRVVGYFFSQLTAFDDIRLLQPVVFPGVWLGIRCHGRGLLPRVYPDFTVFQIIIDTEGGTSEFR